MYYFRTHVLDCSAAENTNVREIFKNLLILSKIKVVADDSQIPVSTGNYLTTSPKSQSKSSSGGGLRRNFSAYGRLKNQGKGQTVSRKEIFDALESSNGHKKLAAQVF